MSACRRGSDATGPTMQPSFTYTPRSTALPSLTPTLEPGTSDNPIRLYVLRPSGVASRGSVNNAVTRLRNALQEASGVTLEITLVDSDAESVRALCSALTSDRPTAAWVSALGYSAASGLDCAVPSLQVERIVDGESQTSQTIQIIANEDSGITSIAGLDGSVFCRVSYNDQNSWIVPMLIMQANGLSPISGPDEIRDIEDTQSLIEAVVSGACDAASVSITDLEALADAEARSAVRLLNPRLVVPNPVLIYSPIVPLGQRNALDAALLALGEEGANEIETLLGADDIARIQANDLSDWTAFIGRADIDFSEWRGSS